MSSYAISAIALFSFFWFIPGSFWSFIFPLALSTIIIISFCHNVTSFPAVLKIVNKKSFKNKMQQPHFIFYYYIYSIYINTYINILHVQPILKGGGGRTQKTYEDLWRWGERGEKAQGCSLGGSVSFHLLFLSTLDTHAAFWGRGEQEAFLSWPSRGSCRSWICCLEFSGACCWTDCAVQDHPKKNKKSIPSVIFKTIQLSNMFV